MSYVEKSRLKICLHWYNENHHYIPLGAIQKEKDVKIIISKLFTFYYKTFVCPLKQQESKQ